MLVMSYKRLCELQNLEINRLRKALWFYADDSNYTKEIYGSVSHIDIDEGFEARKALMNTEEQSEMYRLNIIINCFDNHSSTN